MLQQKDEYVKLLPMKQEHFTTVAHVLAYFNFNFTFT